MRMMSTFIKAEYSKIADRIAEDRRFIQVIMGPRQIGKTTLVRQVLKASNIAHHFIAADAVASTDQGWIEQQWETARYLIKNDGASEALLVIDEIQKIENWAEVIKMLWDQDTFTDTKIKVILLGSARLLLQQGLTESLAGRYEVIQMTHWNFAEMEAAFGFSVEQYVWFGGYPGAASLIADEERWKDYILNSLIETTISKDILMLTRIDKPAILRRLFELGSSYSGKILSITKIQGQLQDAGNTTTLSHYVQLLDSAGLLSGLEKYTPDFARQRASIPKWQVHNTAFSSALSQTDFKESQSKPDLWGHFVETAIGTHLVRAARLGEIKLQYWREGNDEIDFVIERKGKTIGLEIKSGRSQSAKGIEAFKKKANPHKILMVGNSGIPWQSFLKANIADLF
jgi:uncharacterized protein